MKWRVALVLVTVCAVCAAFITSPVAAIRDAPQSAEVFETASAVHYSYRTPTIAVLGADTARVTVRLRDVPYLEMTSGPTWRLLLGVRSSDVEADTVNVEMWHGRHAASRLLYRSAILDSTVMIVGTPRAFDIATIPLSIMQELTLYVVNPDSAAAYYDLDLTLIK